MLAPLHKDRQCELAIGILFDCTYALYTSGVPVKFKRRQMKIEQPKRVTLLCHLPCPLGIASPYKLRAPFLFCCIFYLPLPQARHPLPRALHSAHGVRVGVGNMDGPGQRFAVIQFIHLILCEVP